jgi:hypothetical protein
MTYDRRWIVDLLRRLGYKKEADEASRVLPDQVSLQELQEFGAKHGITREELTDQMGSSP